MTAVILDRDLERSMIRRRRRLGIDLRDEVWDGVYVMSPAADHEHQRLSGDLYTAFKPAINDDGLGSAEPNVNISDRKRGWRKNYRCPDIAVFLHGNPAEDLGTFWHGGPDFAIEIVSPRDRTRKKIPFYEKVGTRELLIVDRHPWKLTLLRLQNGSLTPVGESADDSPALLASQVIPLSFRLIRHDAQPAIEVTHHDGQRHWTVAARLKRG